jgi:hypothetical protein
MLAVGFDTLKLARKYESAGFQPKQAQDMAAALADIVGEAGGNVATKDEVQQVKVTLHEDIVRLEGKLETKIEATNTKIEATKAEILKWMFGAMATQTFILLAALFGLLHSVVKF